MNVDTLTLGDVTLRFAESFGPSVGVSRKQFTIILSVIESEYRAATDPEYIASFERLKRQVAGEVQR